MKRTILFLLIFSSCLLSQVEYSIGSNFIGEGPLFYLDTANYKSKEPNKTRIDFFIQVPYSGIQFIKNNNIFFASYNITITFMDKDKSNILSDSTWKETVETKDFRQTSSRSNYNLSYQSFDLKPGDYFFKCSVEDLDSRKTSIREFPFTVRAINDTLGLSDIVLISEIVLPQNLYML